MITADQLVAHAVGDYVIQSHWMATEKTKHWTPALIHAASYSLPFLLMDASWLAMLVIAGTHAMIDRYRLARWLVWWRNEFFRPHGDINHLPVGQPFPDDCPPFLGVWLVIIADNVAHVLINAAALRWL